jgi:PII-like signaling protein
MMAPAKRVVIAIDEADHWEHRPLASAIIERLRAAGAAGTTVLRGIAGFGVHRQVHTTALVELSSNLPILIVWVDQADKVDRLLPDLLPLLREGLVTVEAVEVVMYQQRATD